MAHWACALLTVQLGHHAICLFPSKSARVTQKEESQYSLNHSVGGFPPNGFVSLHCIHWLHALASSKPISMIWCSHKAYSYEDRNALINTSKLAHPDGRRSNKPNPLGTRSFFASPLPSSRLRLPTSVQLFLPLLGSLFFFMPPSKRLWNSIELVLDGAWETDWFWWERLLRACEITLAEERWK